MGALMDEDKRVNPPWRDHADALYGHFAAMTQHCCLLWVDPSQADPFEGHDLVEQSRVRVPIRHPRFEPSLAPYVVPLDLSRSADSDLFSSSVELAWKSWSTEYLNAMLGQPICGWVRSESNAGAVARHWGTRCHLHMVRRQARLCRFQDPGVREWLWPTLSEIQQRAMLGPASEIMAIGRAQQLVHHTSHYASGLACSSEIRQLDSFPSLQLEQATWDRLDDYASVHAAWLTWRNSGDRDAVEAQSPGWERSILHALAQAGKLGVRDALDRELFALHALQSGPGFYRHSKLDDIWTKTRAGEFYGSAVEEVTGRPADRLGEWIHTLINS